MKHHSSIERAGFSISEWGEAANLGRTSVYKVINKGHVRTAKVGRRTIILTHPKDFLESHVEPVEATGGA